MTYAIIKVINENFFIHSEGITDLSGAKSQFHGLCQVLWNASDVITGCVAIVDENLEVVSEINVVNPMYGNVRYQEFITHTPPNDTVEE